VKTGPGLGLTLVAKSEETGPGLGLTLVAKSEETGPGLGLTLVVRPGNQIRKALKPN